MKKNKEISVFKISAQLRHQNFFQCQSVFRLTYSLDYQTISLICILFIEDRREFHYHKEDERRKFFMKLSTFQNFNCFYGALLEENMMSHVSTSKEIRNMQILFE